MTTSLAAGSAPEPGSDPTAPVAVLFDEHCAFVCRALRHLGIDDASLDDAVQDVFVTAHRRWSSFEGRSTARSWLYGIARRIAFRYRRSAHARAQHLVATDEPTEGVDEPFARAQAAHSLDALLRRIDRDKRTVFVLSELEGMTAPEIADALQLPVGTVYSRLRAAWQGLGREAERERTRLRRAHRHRGDPSSDRRRRMWGMIATGLAPPSLAPIATTTAASTGWLAQLKWLVVGGALGAGLVGARLATVDSHPRRTTATATELDAKHTRSSESRAHRLPLPAEANPETTPPLPTPRSDQSQRPEPGPELDGASDTSASSTVHPTTTDALRAELRLIRDAKRALREGRPDDALALLDRHGRRFPRGQLVDERRATRLRALCAAGRLEDASSQAEALGRDPSAACSS